MLEKIVSNDVRLDKQCQNRHYGKSSFLFLDSPTLIKQFSINIILNDILDSNDGWMGNIIVLRIWAS